MKKEVYSVKVRTEDGKILITQGNYDQDSEDHVVCVTADQVELLCAWLKQAADEIGE